MEECFIGGEEEIIAKAKATERTQQDVVCRDLSEVDQLLNAD